MDQRIGQLEAIWTGQASSAYVARYHEFKPGFDNMRQLIEEIALALGKATDAFEQTDQSAAQAMRS
jgi:WXG100 family type VII secretion target